MFITKNNSFVLLSFLLLSSLLYSLAYEIPYPETEVETEINPRDPKSPRWEIEQCQRRCVERGERGQREVQRCQQRCEEEAIKRREQEQERGQREWETESHHDNPEDPRRRRFEECLDVCRRQPRTERQQCEKSCRREFEKPGGRNPRREMGRGEEEEQQESGNPYFFHPQKFRSRFETQHGHFRVLQRFSKRSKLFQGIDDYRFGVLEANPNTFVVPHHWDSEAVFFVLRGNGTITSVVGEKRESHNLECGDVMRVPAGATIYLINPDDNEKLRVAMLLYPVNTPGKFRQYFSAGGQDPESFYRVFSNDILETALATPRDQLDRLFGQQRQGIIFKAPRETLRSLSQHATSTKRRGHEFRHPFNLLNQKPVYSNNFGQFFEASPDDFKQLQDLEVSVGFADIKQGSLMVPHFNSKTTFIVTVVEGSGRIEMACPHVSSQSGEEEYERRRGPSGRRGEQEESSRFEKVASHLSPGDVFIIPAGHPVALLASENSNLRTLGFGINARFNQRNFLAGQNNIMNQVEREAKELAFNVPGEQVEKIFKNQKESHFVAGPRQRQGEKQGRGHPLETVLDLPGLF